MKKINFTKYLALLFLTVALVACQDNDKQPFEINIEDGPFGNFIRLDISSAPVLDVTDLANAQFGGLFTNPSGNTASYTLTVRRVSGGVMTDYVPLVTLTSFPAEFFATPANIAAALGVLETDLLAGDRFDFEASSVGTDGSVATFDGFAPNLQGNPGMAQGYRFQTFISCPFVQADALGTYVSTQTDFNSFPAGSNFQVVAGADSGEIIMQNPFQSPDPDGVGYNVPINVTPFGIATVPDGVSVFDTDATGNAGFTDTFTDNAGGFVFSCVGAIVLTWDLDLNSLAGGAFTWGTNSFRASKI